MVKNTLTVGRIEEGFVLDHIQAGRSMDIYKYLHLDKLDWYLVPDRSVSDRVSSSTSVLYIVHGHLQKKDTRLLS